MTTIDDIKVPDGAKKLTPLEMNKLAILKDHTVITFSNPNSEENYRSHNTARAFHG